MNLSVKDDLVYDSIVNLMVNSYGDTEAAEIILHLMHGKEVDSEELASLPQAFYSETRGAPFHYRRFFPNEVELDYVCRILKGSTQ